MATAITDIANAVAQDLGERLDFDEATFLSQSQLVAMVAAALAEANILLPNHCAYVPTRVNGRVTTNSTITPTVDIDSKFGILLRFLCLKWLAVSGYIVRGEQEPGNYSGAGGSFSGRNRHAVQLQTSREIHQTLVEPCLAAIKGKFNFQMPGLDYELFYNNPVT